MFVKLVLDSGYFQPKATRLSCVCPLSTVVSFHCDFSVELEKVFVEQDEEEQLLSVFQNQFACIWLKERTGALVVTPVSLRGRFLKLSVPWLINWVWKLIFV